MASAPESESKITPHKLRDRFFLRKLVVAGRDPRVETYQSSLYGEFGKPPVQEPLSIVHVLPRRLREGDSIRVIPGEIAMYAIVPAIGAPEVIDRIPVTEAQAKRIQRELNNFQEQLKQLGINR